MSGRVDTVPTHGHVVAFYEHEADLSVAVAAFLGEALGAGGTAIVAATPEHQASIRAALGPGLPIDQLERAGRYVVLDARTTLDACMRDDAPDRDLFASTLEPVLAPARGPVRVFGEMVALLWEDDFVSAAIELESLWNHLADRSPFGLFCAYPMAALDGDETLAPAKHICDRHSDSLTLGKPGPTARGPNGDATRVFVPARAALTDVRRFVREVLDGWELHARIDDAQLVASELAANATLHADSPFRVSLSRNPSTITIAVRDACLDRPIPRIAGSTEVGGRGLELVGVIAAAWGTRAESDGKTVWATLALESVTV